MELVTYLPKEVKSKGPSLFVTVTKPRNFPIVTKEFYRVLKPRKYCAIFMGDTRRQKHKVPNSFRVMQAFLEIGFALKENIIKLQHNTQTEHRNFCILA